MSQAVSRRPLTAESRVRARVNPFGICGRQSGTGTGISPSSSVFPCQYHSTVVLNTHVSSVRWICPSVAAVQRRKSHPINKKIAKCMMCVTMMDNLETLLTGRDLGRGWKVSENRDEKILSTLTDDKALCHIARREKPINNIDAFQGIRCSQTYSLKCTYSPGRTFGLPFRGFLVTHTDTR
jgi:hypothetical protein